ncbi:molybdate ABC transporter substrate-binding protein [Pannonibacter tanglangensis]|uniref:molybdate ABC transporter substrate-binding protein n=1 Tax=Pannonibacter tanglangensis TaxID=2750084 RepID=UPI0032999B29
MRPFSDLALPSLRKTLAAACALAVLTLSAGLGAVPAARAAETTVFAAASLKTALDEITAAYAAGGGGKVTVSYGGSSTLAKQIEQGAPADIFISASVDWMDTLAEGKLIRPDSRVDLLGNTLVLVAHGADAPKLEISGQLDLAGLLGDGRLAMALVDSVPAGVYGKAALTSLGLWPSVEAKVVQSNNVRIALSLVASGDAPFGIVYASDARAESNVSVVGTFPAGSHAPIVFPVALTADARPEAEAFLAFLLGASARAAFERQGFQVLAN